jgi:undecaprenyl pyrophosphate phosphatase UppP
MENLRLKYPSRFKRALHHVHALYTGSNRMIAVSPPCAAFLYDQYDKIFGSPWPVIPSALVIATVNVFLFAFERRWTPSDGLRNWSNGLLQLFGLIQQPALLPPLLYSGSCLNLGLLLGAMASRQFLFARI